MAHHRSHRAAPAAAFHERLAGRRWLALALAPILLIAAVALARATTIRTDLTAPAIDGGAAALTPGQLKAAAADAFERLTDPGGAGYTFEIVQRSTLVAKAGGPRIQVPDPADFHTVKEVVDRYEVGSLIERGAVTPDGFWMEMRSGPQGDDKPDWTAEYQFGALVRDGTTYRNDGEGWYETDRPPGIGLDPRTAALLPTLLRNVAQPKAATVELIPGQARALTASAAVKDIPGIVAVDGEPFTRLDAPAELAFDDAGRLIGLRIVAQNTNETTFDLLIETVISFAYPEQAADLPEPSPAYTRTTPITTP